LRTLGMIKKVTQTYRYYLTRLGRAAIAAACSLTRFNSTSFLLWLQRIEVFAGKVKTHLVRDGGLKSEVQHPSA
jgi:hypothetical protein